MEFYLANLPTWAILILTILYCMVGYQIAQISKENYLKWGKGHNPATCVLSQLILFPVNTLYRTNAESEWWLMINRYQPVVYNLLHIFFWPVRLACNIVLLILVYTIISALFFVILLLIETIKSLVVNIRRMLTNIWHVISSSPKQASS